MNDEALETMQAGFTAFGSIFKMWLDTQKEIEPERIQRIIENVSNQTTAIRAILELPVGGVCVITYFEVGSEDMQKLFSVYGRDYLTN